MIATMPKIDKKTLNVRKVLIASIIMLLTLCLLLVPAASAEESATKTSEKIYYSDLFYGYDTSYLLNDYIENYYDDVDDVARDIFNDYINSPRYFWTKIESSIAAALDARAFFELMSDTYGGTNFNYSDAIDSANILFAKELVGETDSMQMMGDVEKLTKKANKIIGICNDYEKYFNAEETHVVVIEKFFDTLAKSDVFDAYGKTYLSSIKTQFIAEAEAAGLWLSSSKELISYLKAISVGLMLEELRLEMLDDIIENSYGYKTVHDGMTRLRSQLVQGFSSYVVKTYMQDKVVDAIFSAMQKAITGQVSAYGFVSAVLKTASWVLFDVLFDIPNMDDMLVQMVLNEYVDGFHFILRNKASSFKMQFDSDDVIEYETIFNGLNASCKALLEASGKLTLSSNKSTLTAVKNRHKNFSYDNYIKVVKDIISATPEAERKVKKFNEWTINEATCFTPASDTIEDGRIYKFGDGFYGNIVINTEFNIDSSSNIYGDVKVNKNLSISKGMSVTVEEIRINGNVEVEKGSALTANGNIVISDGSLTNDGTVSAVGLVEDKPHYSYKARYSQSDSNAVLNLTGNFTGVSSDFSSITAGTVIFSGITQQTVQGLKAYNIEVLNPEGIKYLSNVSVYGTYDLHGNPLDNAEFITTLYDQADIVSGSNYRDLCIRSKSKTYSYDILCDSLKIDYYDYAHGYAYGSEIIIDDHATVTITETLDVYKGSLSLSENSKMTVGEEVKVNDYLAISEGASLTVDGNILISDGIINNSGTINAVDLTGPNNSSSKYTQSNDEAVLNLTGNFTGLSSDFSNITAGTVIFSGTSQQTVQGLKAYNVEVLNPEGIKYLYNINVYGNFDAHQNPIAENSYKTNFHGEGGFGTLPEHQSDWIIGLQPTYTTVGERYKECLVCGEKICQEEIPVLIKPNPDECQHSFSEWETITVPTCTDPGMEERTCSICDYTEERVTTALGHAFGEWIETKAHTCTEIGEECRDCKACDHFETREVEALGHDTIKHSAQSATRTEIGWNAYVTCSRCDYTTYAEILARGHEHHCSVTAPTCTEKGYTTHTCACGDSYVGSYVDAYGHDLGERMLTKAPTCTGVGEERRECGRCDYFEARDLPIVDHADDDANGTCDMCGKQMSSDEEPSGGCLSVLTISSYSVLMLVAFSFLAVLKKKKE